MCAKKDKKVGKTCKFVEVEQPGDRLGIDLLELRKNDKIFLAIDYFSRKIFGKTIKTKEAVKIVEFLKEIYKVFPFKEMITDNGKEFENKNVMKWAEQNNVKHTYSVPYYHQSNGRIERANRTIRNAFRKTPGITKTNLSKVLENYNHLRHRGINMSTNEAIKEQNWVKVKKYTENYKKEYARYNKAEKSYEIGENILFKNENRLNKMDDEFGSRAK
jgi:transposase InsO family protein